jgi:hypothetical protein
MNKGSSTINTGTGDEFVRIALGKSRLLLPASELLSIESATGISPSHEHPGSCGHIMLNNKELPVYAFDDDLQQKPVMDNPKQMCVCLDNGRDQFGIICDHAGKVILDNMKLHELPVCMQRPDSLIRVVGEKDNNLYCITSTADLMQLVRQVDLD